MDAIRAPRFTEIRPAVAPPRAGAAGAAGFAQDLGRAVQSLEQVQAQADEQATKVALGGGNLHEAVLSAEKADLSMRLAVRVRNRFVDAYQEVMRMQV